MTKKKIILKQKTSKIREISDVLVYLKINNYFPLMAAAPPTISEISVVMAA